MNHAQASLVQQVQRALRGEGTLDQGAVKRLQDLHTRVQHLQELDNRFAHVRVSGKVRDLADFRQAPQPGGNRRQGSLTPPFLRPETAAVQ